MESTWQHKYGVTVLLIEQLYSIDGADLRVASRSRLNVGVSRTVWVGAGVTCRSRGAVGEEIGIVDGLWKSAVCWRTQYFGLGVSSGQAGKSGAYITTLAIGGDTPIDQVDDGRSTENHQPDALEMEF